jgi:hypothetical protein
VLREELARRREVAERAEFVLRAEREGAARLTI